MQSPRPSASSSLEPAWGYLLLGGLAWGAWVDGAARDAVGATPLASRTAEPTRKFARELTPDGTSEQTPTRRLHDTNRGEPNAPAGASYVDPALVRADGLTRELAGELVQREVDQRDLERGGLDTGDTEKGDTEKGGQDPGELDYDPRRLRLAAPNKPVSQNARVAEHHPAVDAREASARELRRLPGVGEVRALELARARWRMGASAVFNALEDVPGIGPVTARRIESYMREHRWNARNGNGIGTGEGEGEGDATGNGAGDRDGSDIGNDVRADEGTHDGLPRGVRPVHTKSRAGDPRRVGLGVTRPAPDPGGTGGRP